MFPAMTGETAAPKTLEGWALVQSMLADLTAAVEKEAETDLELVEGIRVLGRITALCSELSLDADPDVPFFFDMNTEARYVGGPNPDGSYQLAMIDGRRRYRLTGNRNSVTYLGFQILAGTGMTPRRMAAHLSDRELPFGGDRSFAMVLSATQPSAEDLGDATWLEIPEDASAIVVRQYAADRRTEQPASLAIEPLDDPGPPAVPTDQAVGEQLVAMAWTIAKLATLHRTIKPELLEQPNQLVFADPAEIGAADSTPDNLYVIGTFRLAPDEALVVDMVPPRSRYWSVTLENIWHECIDVRRRRSSLTNATASVDADGRCRVVVAATDPGAGNWLDTGGRHRGFVLVRWLDSPEPPPLSTRVVPLADVATLP
jgi:hypothetical protein